LYSRALLTRRCQELVVILAGYPADMEQLLQANSGLKSRFPVTVHLPDYSAEELVHIAEGMLLQMQMVLVPAAAQAHIKKKTRSL
jgi:stage V sporulation protein K